MFNKDKTVLIQYPAGKSDTYTITNGVTSIGDYAFYGCESLINVELSDSVTTIESYAFSGCASLKSITIPSSVTSIGYGAFTGCKSLTLIIVEEGNKVYHSNKLCLIETASKTVVLGLNGSGIPTDGSVTSIGDYAFYNFTLLTSITIPDGITSIGKDAFRGCASLTSITIPDSVTSIGAGAFRECSSLTSITFNGTKEEWGAIEKYWDYNTGDYTIHCTDGDIEK